MNNLWRWGCLVVVGVLLAGCTTGPTRVVNLDGGGEKRIGPGDLVNIAVSAEVLGRKEMVVGMFGMADTRLLILTGPVWRDVFIGAADAPARLEITSSTLNESMAGMGMTMRYTYTVEASLKVGDKAYPIKATGTRAAAMMMDSARRQAVELAVVDAARKATAILAMIKTEG